MDRCGEVGKPSDGVSCGAYWMQRDKTWSFCAPHASEDSCVADSEFLPHCWPETLRALEVLSPEGR